MNNSNNSNNERLSALEKKVDTTLDLLKKVLGLEMNELDLKVQLNEKAYTLDLVSEIQDIDNYDAILELLNELGDKNGYNFKKGPMTKKKGELPSAKTIVCRYYNRNPEKSLPDEQISEPNLIKHTNCKAFYRFMLNIDGSVFLTTFNQSHSHPPNFSLKSELTDAMKLEIGRFHKRSKVTEIKDHIETTFNCKINYSTVYNEFRRQFPLFGPDDCQKFIEFLETNNCAYKNSLEENTSLSKLIFSTQIMRKNYEKFSDIVLIDSTYKTNFYSVPLVILSGVDHNYQNILFAIGLINNETAETYSWIMDQFCQIHNNRKPDLMISDSEAAIISAIENRLQGTPHRLCSWHIVRNLRRYFGFIKSDNEEIKNKIFKLPFLKDRKVFDESVLQIQKFFLDNDLKKSKAYLETLLDKKEKWTPCYYESHFDGDITTTSRAESWNSHIKKYLNSRSEICDIITFIRNIEGTTFIEKEKINTEVLKYLELDPLVTELKGFLTSRIYLKQLHYYCLAKRYESKLISDINEIPTYEVLYNPPPSNDKGGELRQHSTYSVKVGDYFTCSCQLFQRMGIVCAHIFHICLIKNVKTISNLKISDRWRKSIVFESNIHFKDAVIAINNPKKEEVILENLIDKEKEVGDDGELEIVESKELLSALQTQTLKEKESKQEDEANIEEEEVKYQPELIEVSQKKKVENFKKKTNTKGAPKKSKVLVSFC